MVKLGNNKIKSVSMLAAIAMHVILFLPNFIPKQIQPPVNNYEVILGGVNLLQMPTKENTNTDSIHTITERVQNESVKRFMCKDQDRNYVGIGFIHNIGTGVIFEAPFDLPAYKAGIRVGDILISKKPDNRVPGEAIEVIVERNGVEITFNVVAERICYNKIAEYGQVIET